MSRKNKREKRVLYPRHTILIIFYFMSKHNNNSKRATEPQHTPQFDDVVKKMKIRAKATFVYGLRLPKGLLNEAVKSYMAYKTYGEEMKKLEVSTTQPQPVESTEETHTESSNLVVRIRGKQKKEKGKARSASELGSVTKKARVQKRTLTINEQIHAEELAAIRLVKVLSANEKCQNKANEKQKEIFLKQEIDQEVDETDEFEANELKRLKLKQVATITLGQQEQISMEKAIKMSRQEHLAKIIPSRGGEGLRVMIQIKNHDDTQLSDTTTYDDET
nr:hypothetical protein [Tanacetum cinerariifolium]